MVKLRFHYEHQEKDALVQTGYSNNESPIKNRTTRRNGHPENWESRHFLQDGGPGSRLSHRCPSSRGSLRPRRDPPPEPLPSPIGTPIRLIPETAADWTRSDNFDEFLDPDLEDCLQNDLSVGSVQPAGSQSLEALQTDDPRNNTNSAGQTCNCAKPYCLKCWVFEPPAETDEGIDNRQKFTNRTQIPVFPGYGHEQGKEEDPEWMGLYLISQSKRFEESEIFVIQEEKNRYPPLMNLELFGEGEELYGEVEQEDEKLTVIERVIQGGGSALILGSAPCELHRHQHLIGHQSALVPLHPPFLAFRRNSKMFLMLSLAIWNHTKCSTRHRPPSRTRCHPVKLSAALAGSYFRNARRSANQRRDHDGWARPPTAQTAGHRRFVPSHYLAVKERIESSVSWDENTNTARPVCLEAFLRSEDEVALELRPSEDWFNLNESCHRSDVSRREMEQRSSRTERFIPHQSCLPTYSFRFDSTKSTSCMDQIALLDRSPARLLFHIEVVIPTSSDFILLMCTDVLRRLGQHYSSLITNRIETVHDPSFYDSSKRSKSV
ncbi:unnamed protein product [Nesidiocoris tenuis]|uniref:Uncharacterized protein n=1 Tax=Nesidiocoris tenuis TaxID=355587 RepID=A0A6H5G912_9HEMI|nr:unnamed protein product [Nesidiocoris tenuis]